MLLHIQSFINDTAVKRSSHSPDQFKSRGKNLNNQNPLSVASYTTASHTSNSFINSVGSRPSTLEVKSKFHGHSNGPKNFSIKFIWQLYILYEHHWGVGHHQWGTKWHNTSACCLFITRKMRSSSVQLVWSPLTTYFIFSLISRIPCFHLDCLSFYRSPFRPRTHTLSLSLPLPPFHLRTIFLNIFHHFDECWMNI